MKLIILLISLLIAIPAHAQVLQGVFQGTLGGGSSANTGTLLETFNGGTSDVTWTEWVAGTFTSGYSTSPAPLTGAGSLLANGSLYRSASLPSAMSEIWMTIQMQITTETGAAEIDMPRILDNAGDCLLSMVFAWTAGTHSWGITGNTNSACGAGLGTAVGTIHSGTTFFVQIHYKKGTGSDAVSELYYSADGTTWEAALISHSSGTNTADAQKVAVGAYQMNQNIIIDQVRYSATQIMDAR